MGPLEAAKALDTDIGPCQLCNFCTGSAFSGHFEGCPRLAVPRIVAVLEAVERVLAADDLCGDRCLDWVLGELETAMGGGVVPPNQEELTM